MVRTLKLSLILILAAIIAACASSDGDSGGGIFVDESSRAAQGNYHPATNLNDRFPVRRRVPSSDNSGAPFYFKQCSRETGDFYNTKTRYDCNY